MIDGLGRVGHEDAALEGGVPADVRHCRAVVQVEVRHQYGINLIKYYNTYMAIIKKKSYKYSTMTSSELLRIFIITI